MTLTTLALCWRIERRDGVAIGLTDHDRPILRDGIVHSPAPGMVPSAIARSDGLEPDTMDVTGALSSAAIAPADLLAGRWDGARVALSAVDWESDATIELGEGTLGAIETRDAAFTGELTGPTAALAAPVVEETSPECRAELGDRRCRVPLRRRRRLARVVAIADLVLTLDGTEPEPGAYRDGRLRWLGGANCGIEAIVATSAGSTVTLRGPPAFEIAPGTRIALTEGCDKSIATCAGRFGNAANFRGEPYLPGVDLLTRYPGA